MSEPIEIPCAWSDNLDSAAITITPDLARQIVALALADVCHPLNDHEKRIAALEAIAKPAVYHAGPLSAEDRLKLLDAKANVGDLVPSAWASAAQAMGAKPVEWDKPQPVADDAAKLHPSLPLLISADGTIKNKATGTVYNPQKCKYKKITLTVNGKRRNFPVHRLVCETFHGPCPDRMECDHIDRDRHNNAASNLRWVMRSTNNLNRETQRGHMSKSAKLNAAGVEAVHAMYKAGFSQQKIANAFGVTQSAIYLIVNGHSYAGAPA